MKPTSKNDLYRYDDFDDGPDVEAYERMDRLRRLQHVKPSRLWPTPTCPSDGWMTTSGLVLLPVEVAERQGRVTDREDGT